MKRLLTYLFSAMIFFAVGCSEGYDDSALVNRMDSLENRIAKLEELCKQMNTNISSLQSLVNALQNNDYVTNVTPVTKNGETIGYTITFTKSQPITIYHGDNGKDGHTPIVGVKQASDGIYYWTLDGEWMLDASGSKIKAQGINGKDGVTPQLKIENDYWYISYDNGTSWSKLGKATGENGNDGDSFFQDIDISNSDYVIFTLANGTELTLPKHKNLSISFDVESGVACMPSASIKVGYTLIGADNETTIETIGEGGWKSTVTKTDISSGYITVTAPANGGDGKVVMLATTSNGFTTMKAISFDEGVLSGINDAYQVGCETSTLSVTLNTNLEYAVNISEDAKLWISVADTRAAIRMETLTFIIDENTDINHRTANIELVDKNGKILQKFIIMQDGMYCNVGFKSPVNSEGVTAVYLKFRTPDEIIAKGPVTYQLPLVVSSSAPYSRDLNVNIELDLDSLEKLNIKNIGVNRSDIWWKAVPEDAVEYPTQVTIPAGKSEILIDIEFDFSKLDLVNRYILPLKVVDSKTNNTALLHVNPFNDYSGSYSAATMLGYVADENGQFSSNMLSQTPITINNKTLYVVDEDTAFFYPGIIDHTYKHRADYKVYVHFGNGGALTFEANNPDIDFQVVGTALYEQAERYNNNKPYILYKYVIMQVTYDFTDNTGIVPTRYRFKGAMTLQRAINTQIADENQAIQW